MTVRLTYFNLLARGEPIRLLLILTKTKFQDVRVNLDEWIIMKNEQKWPHLPKLEIDGKELYQFRAICRYLANKAGLIGTNAYENYLIDAAVDALEDMRDKVADPYYLPDSPERDAGLKKATYVIVPFYYDRFQQQIVENGGYLAGGKMTWADIVFTAYDDHVSELLGGVNFLENFPELKMYTNKIKELPEIKEWIASQPKHPKDLRVLFP